MPSARRASGLNTLSSLVYSTDSGRVCPGCGQAVADCRCAAIAAAAARPPGDGVVRVSRETKGRGGKAVTLVRGVPLDDAGLAVLAKELKAACGSGGTVKDGVIEVQGDHVATLLQKLSGRGWTVKRAGG
jgi:translation initiation factor 1